MTKLPANNTASFECPFCRRTFSVGRDSFAFVRSQIIVHLDRCEQRPSNMTADRITSIAHEIAARLRT